MDNTKDDKYFMRKIIENIDVVLHNTDGLNLEEIKQNEMLLDSVMFRFIQIAEAAQSLSTSFKSQTASLPWHELYGIRKSFMHMTLSEQISYMTQSRTILFRSGTHY